MPIEITMEQLERMHETARIISLSLYYSGEFEERYDGDKVIMPQKPRTATKKALLEMDKKYRAKRQQLWESKLTDDEKQAIKSRTISIDDLQENDRIPFLIYWHGRQECELEGRYRFAKECVPRFYAVRDELLRKANR